MTLQEMLNQALNECGFSTYNLFVGASEPEPLQVLGLAQRELMDLSRSNWQVLEKTYEIELTGADSYPLPADYRKFIFDTAFSNTHRMSFPASDSAWSYYKISGRDGGGRYMMRIVNNRLEVMSQDIGTKIRVHYFSKAAVLKDNGLMKTRFESNNDMIVLDDDLFMMGVIWRFNRAKGLEWESLKADYRRHRRNLLGTDRSSQTIVMTDAESSLPEPQADLMV